MKKILIFNFYDGILKRGIPIYTNNLLIPISRDHKITIIKAPKYLNKMPRVVADLLFVFYEQIITPLVAFFGGYDKVVYPYNSTSIISALVGNSMLIIHDFIPNKKLNKKISLSALYIVATQFFHGKLNRDTAYVSKTTLRLSTKVKNINQCNKFYFPNSFYLFEDNLKLYLKNKKEVTSEKNKYILLISGISENKQFKEAIQLFASLKQDIVCLKVLGFGSHITQAKSIVLELGININNIDFIPTVSDFDVINYISRSEFIWVHSIAEGFGRPVVEGRLCGKTILASNIAAFREHSDAHTFTYNADDFKEKFCAALCDDSYAKKQFYNYYHIELEKELKRWLAL